MPDKNKRKKQTKHEITANQKIAIIGRFGLVDAHEKALRDLAQKFPLELICYDIRDQFALTVETIEDLSHTLFALKARGIIAWDVIEAIETACAPEPEPGIARQAGVENRYSAAAGLPDGWEY